MNRQVALPMFAVTLFVLSGCRTYCADQRFDLTAPWKDYQRIVVRSPKGSVTLRTADVPEIRISGTMRAIAFAPSKAEENLKHVEIIAEPDTSKPSVFVIRVRHPWWLGSRSVGGSFEIQVPAPCAADIRTRDGAITVSGLTDEAILKTSHNDVTIDGVTGRVQAWTRNGAIVAENVMGNLTAETTNGPIRVKAIQGDCGLTTSNGRIVAESVTGNLTAETTTGRIEAKAIRGTCRLQTSIGTIEAEDIHGGIEAMVSIGDIRAEVIPPEDADVAARTRYGSIDLTLPAGLKADLDLRTDNGVVQMGLENVPLRVQLWSQNHVRASINGGGGTRIVAATSSGLITLKSR